VGAQHETGGSDEQGCGIPVQELCAVFRSFWEVHV